MKTLTLLNSLFNSAFLMTILMGIASISSAQEGLWLTKTNMPTTRGFLSGTVLGDKIYIVGGSATQNTTTSVTEMYDPGNDSWTAIDSMPEGRCNPAVCAYDGRIYLFGGASTSLYSSGMKNVYVYDPQTNSWSEKADMPYANSGCGIAVLNDIIYLIGGGLSVGSSPFSNLMAYDPATDTWLEKEPMPTARFCPSACVVDGKIYVIGGTTESYNSIAYKLVEVYDPVTDTWTKKADMSTGRMGLGTCVIDGKIYAVGGWRYGEVLTTNEMYDPDSDTWISKIPMQQKRFLHFIGSVGNRIYAIGGAYPNPNNRSQAILLSSVEEFNPALDTDPTALIENNLDTSTSSFMLCQNYPNPFYHETLIKYVLSKPASVVLQIINVLGQEVHRLEDEDKPAGSYEVTWDGKNKCGQQMLNGIYFCKLIINNECSETMKLIMQ